MKFNIFWSIVWYTSSLRYLAEDPVQTYQRYAKCVCINFFGRLRKMFGCFPIGFPVHFCSNFSRNLAFTWLTGLSFGAYIACSTDPSLLSQMHSISIGTVSIIGLAIVLLLPLLLTALAVFISKIQLLIPIAFAKAFFFAYLSAAILYSGRLGNWIIWLLLLFSDICAMPILLWLWMQLPQVKRPSWILTGSTIAIICIGFLDLQFISPFLANILS